MTSLKWVDLRFPCRAFPSYPLPFTCATGSGSEVDSTLQGLPPRGFITSLSFRPAPHARAVTVMYPHTLFVRSHVGLVFMYINVAVHILFFQKTIRSPPNLLWSDIPLLVSFTLSISQMSRTHSSQHPGLPGVNDITTGLSRLWSRESTVTLVKPSKPGRQLLEFESGSNLYICFLPGSFLHPLVFLEFSAASTY